MTIYEKLLEEFPNRKDGLILGQAKAIVGQFGLELRWNTVDGTYSTKYQENEQIPITQFFKEYFISGDIQNVRLDYRKFKGLSFNKFKT